MPLFVMLGCIILSNRLFDCFNMKNNIAESRFNRIYRFHRYTLYKVMQHDVLVSKAITKLLSDWAEMRAGISTWL